MLKFLKLLVVVFFVNSACINAGYSYVSVNNENAPVFNIFSFMFNKQDISFYKGHVNVSKKVITNVRTLFKSTGNILFDIGNIGSMFVGVNNVKLNTKETSVNINNTNNNYDIISFVEIKQDVFLNQVKLDKSKIKINNQNVNLFNFLYKKQQCLDSNIQRYKSFDVSMCSWQKMKLLSVMSQKFSDDYISLNTNFFCV